MEKLAKLLAAKLAASLDYDAEQEAVVAYGLLAIIQVIITVLLVLAAGFLVKAPLEALVVCLAASVLRKYSGGAHARSAGLCTLFSVLLCTLMAAAAKILATEIYSPLLLLAAAVIIYSCSVVIVYKYAPVASPNKPIRTASKKAKMKKGSFIVLLLYFIITAILFFLSLNFYMGKSLGVSLLFGLSWQIFTLTKCGALFVAKLNGAGEKEVNI